jgi:hypothetical protein
LSLRIAMDFTRLSQKTDAYFFASGGEAEPSPPWQSYPGCAFTQPPPPRFGMEPPRPTDFSPRASIFASASSLSRHPPSARISPMPRRSAPRQHERQKTAASPKPIDGWGGPTIQRHCARRMACASLQSSICRASEHVVSYSRAPASVWTILLTLHRHGDVSRFFVCQ